jgi:hypothetical protein
MADLMKPISPRRTMSFSADAFSSRRRNYQTQGHRRDAMIEWIKEVAQSRVCMRGGCSGGR